MKISEEYRPRKLRDIVGQPPVRLLQKLADNPDARCILLEGGPGVGKTTAALAFAAELGCDSPWSGLEVVVSTELTIDRCRQLFERDLRLRPMEGSGWHVLVIEELEAVASAQVRIYLKDALERNLPQRVIVIATSNGAGGIDPVLLERFAVLGFHNGALLAAAAWERMTAIWSAVCGSIAMPTGWKMWGWRGETFSMRRALDELETHAVMMKGWAMQDEPFQLQRTPIPLERKPLRIVLKDTTRQGVLFPGSECLPGQLDMFAVPCHESAADDTKPH